MEKLYVAGGRGGPGGKIGAACVCWRSPSCGAGLVKVGLRRYSP